MQYISIQYCDIISYTHILPCHILQYNIVYYLLYNITTYYILAVTAFRFLFELFFTVAL